MTLLDNPDYYVSVHSSGNIHCNHIVRWTRGFSTLKKGDYFDAAKEERHAWGRGRLYVATSNFYVDDPEDEIGCIDAEEVYNPEI
jgi:hypothetical protein